MILTNGCSFTEGYDLKDKSKSWPSSLSRLCKCNYINDALGGASNDRISRTLKESLIKYPKPNLVVVGWTQFNRNEIYHNDGIYVRCTNTDCLPECESVIKHTSKMHKHWTVYNLNMWINYRNWIYSILFFQDYFKVKNIKYRFFTAFGNNYIHDFLNKTNDALKLADLSWQWRDRSRYSPHKPIHTEFNELVDLVNKIDLNNWVYYDQSMADEINANNYEIDETGHPKEDGHEFWSNEIYKTL